MISNIRYSYVVNNPLKYTDPSGWLKILPDMVDLDYEMMAYVNALISDYYSGVHSMHAGGGTGTWVMNTYNSTATVDFYQSAGLYGVQGNEWVPVSSMVATQVNSYYTFVSNYTQPFAMGTANVVAPTGDMAAMGGGGSESIWETSSYAFNRAKELMYRFLIPGGDKIYPSDSHPYINAPALGHNKKPLDIDKVNYNGVIATGAQIIEKILCAGDPNFGNGCLTFDPKSDYNKIYEYTKQSNAELNDYISYDLITIAEWNALVTMNNLLFPEVESPIGDYRKLNEFGVSPANITQLKNDGIIIENYLIWISAQNQIIYIPR